MIRAGNHHRIVELSGRSGVYEVDFRTYFYERPRTVFLKPGQYLDVISGGVVARELDVQRTPSSARVLFTHIYEVGSVDGLVASDSVPDALDQAASAWREQRPLHPKQSIRHTELLLDLTDLINLSLPQARSPGEIAQQVGLSHQALNRITGEMTGSTLGQLVADHRTTQAKRLLALSQETIQEIATQVGYTDAAYFSRRFSMATGESPSHFRRRIADRAGDPFVGELMEVLDRVAQGREPKEAVSTHFALAPRSLDAKARRHTGRTVTSLLNRRRAALAMRFLREGASASDTAEALGFSDPFTFSRFFRRETGLPPSQVQIVQETVHF